MDNHYNCIFFILLLIYYNSLFCNLLILLKDYRIARLNLINAFFWIIKFLYPTINDIHFKSNIIDKIDQDDSFLCMVYLSSYFKENKLKVKIVSF